MSLHRLVCLAAALLSGCSMHSNWYLMDSGYSINPIDGDAQGYAVEVHVNQLKQLGGDVNSAEARLFIAERLKWHGVCPAGWQPLPCVQDGSCVQRTRRSVTVPGRCVTP
ncbi:MAG TPA: hypothetical protein VNZ59_07890 [Burkholderiales bacterium]|jgi:hypothetical protein|nr:hypothetical protein [Burkholderiales bacterium]